MAVPFMRLPVMAVSCINTYQVGNFSELLAHQFLSHVIGFAHMF